MDATGTRLSQVQVKRILDAADAEIDAAIADHERRLHPNPYGEPNLPPRRTEDVTAIPFADWVLPDEETVRAIMIMAREGCTEAQAAELIDVPLPVLQRAFADYRGPWRKWLLMRAGFGA